MFELAPYEWRELLIISVFMILIGGVDGRRLSKGAIVAILVLVAFDTGRYAWWQHVQMRKEIRDRIEELTQVCEQIRQERPYQRKEP